MSIRLLFSASLFAVFTNRGNGELVLGQSFSSVLPLCPGEPLHLTCNSSSILVLWSVYTNDGTNLSRNAAASQDSGITRPLPLLVGSFTFNIASQVVNSTGSSNLTLISNMTVENVDVTLNATVIICTEVATGMQDMVTIQILNMNDFQLDEKRILSLLIKNSVFGISNVTTSLEFGKIMAVLNSAILSLVSYNFNATSDHTDMVQVEYDGNASVNIIFPYNTRVFVNIEVFACGQSTVATNTIHFNFTHSLNPISQLESNITLTKCARVESLHRAHSTTLICYSEQHLYQQDVCVITCANGILWEPNIFVTDFVACLDHTTEEPNSTCATNATTLGLTIVSSVTTFILSSFLCFFCGLLNGVAWQRISNRSTSASNHNVNPTYDVIAENTSDSVRRIELEMKQNVAYSTIDARVQQ